MSIMLLLGLLNPLALGRPASCLLTSAVPVIKPGPAVTFAKVQPLGSYQSPRLGWALRLPWHCPGHLGPVQLGMWHPGARFLKGEAALVNPLSPR